MQIALLTALVSLATCITAIPAGKFPSSEHSSATHSSRSHHTHSTSLTRSVDAHTTHFPLSTLTSKHSSKASTSTKHSSKKHTSAHSSKHHISTKSERSTLSASASKPAFTISHVIAPVTFRPLAPDMTGSAYYSSIAAYPTQKSMYGSGGPTAYSTTSSSSASAASYSYPTSTSAQSLTAPTYQLPLYTPTSKCSTSVLASYTTLPPVYTNRASSAWSPGRVERVLGVVFAGGVALFGL